MKEIIKSTSVLLIITLIAGFLLGFVNDMTKAPIAVRADEAKVESLESVIDGEYTINMDKNIKDEVSFDADGVVIDEVYEFSDNGEFSGIVALVTSTEGYSGDIQLTVGIEMKSKSNKVGEVCGIDFLSINETPGLGMNAKDESFISQFYGKSEVLAVSKNAVSENQIDAVSGATITSEAVTDAVNAAISFYNSYVGMEGDS